jgi:hypothetical protein
VKVNAKGLALLALPGGVLVALSVAFASWYSAARTGIRDVDRWAIRGNALLALALAFGTRMSRNVARAFVAGVTVNEGSYTPAEYAPGALYPLGDQGHKLGPSVSPWQILSGLHLRRLGYAGDPVDLARVGSERKAAGYAARIFREAFDEAGEVLGSDAPEGERLMWAVARYNGKWNGDAFPAGAVAYRERAEARIEGLGGLA